MVIGSILLACLLSLVAGIGVWAFASDGFAHTYELLLSQLHFSSPYSREVRGFANKWQLRNATLLLASFIVSLLLAVCGSAMLWFHSSSRMAIYGLVLSGLCLVVLACLRRINVMGKGLRLKRLATKLDAIHDLVSSRWPLTKVESMPIGASAISLSPTTFDDVQIAIIEDLSETDNASYGPVLLRVESSGTLATAVYVSDDHWLVCLESGPLPNRLPYLNSRLVNDSDRAISGSWHYARYLPEIN